MILMKTSFYNFIICQELIGLKGFIHHCYYCRMEKEQSPRITWNMADSVVWAQEMDEFLEIEKSSGPVGRRGILGKHGGPKQHSLGSNSTILAQRCG